MADAVLAVFLDPQSAAMGVTAAKTAGATEVRARMPAPFPEVLAAIGRGPSPLGYFTFTGAILGLSGGYALCIFTSLSWPLVVGGKPIVSLAPFTVIGFEMTVLTGVWMTMIMLGVLAIRGRRKRAVPEDPRFSRDCIGVLAFGADPDGLEKALRESGATEVRRV